MDFFLKLGCLVVSLCFAATSIAGFKVLISPPRLELKILPGQQLTQAMKVRNDDSKPVRMRVKIFDWYHDFEGTVHYEQPGKLEHSCAEWLLINPREFELAPQETRIVRVTAHMPEGSSGTYWTCLFFETVPTPLKGQVALSAKARLISYIYLTCAGTEREKGELVDFITEEVNGETIVKLIFKNNGNVHLRPNGKIEVQYAEGTMLKKFEIKDSVVLPGALRVFSFRVGELDGLCSTSAILDYGVVVSAERIFVAEVSRETDQD